MHRLRAQRLFLAVLLALGAATAAASALATTLPLGFSEQVMAAGLVAPTSFTFLPDGRILIAEQKGLVKVYKNGTVASKPFLDIRRKVNAYFERGLLGIAADPNFASNGYVYLYYIYENDLTHPRRAKTARLTRVRVSGETARRASETVILGETRAASCNDLPAGADCIPADYPSHNGGDIEFAADGTLFLSTGEAASPNAVNNNALRAQNLDLLAGKLLHVTRTGAGLASNPFWNGNPSANRSKVWAYGLRNPFRFTLRPGSGMPYLGDVGWEDWEEVNVAPAGSNLGWPCYEGDARQSGYKRKARCQKLYSKGRPAVTFPLVAYERATVIGGSFYTGTAYPDEYQGAYFYGDFLHGWIEYLRVDAQDRIVEGPKPFADFAGGPVDIKSGPGGNLYYLAISAGELRRVRYAAGSEFDTDSAARPGSSAPFFGHLDLYERVALLGFFGLAAVLLLLSVAPAPVAAIPGLRAVKRHRVQVAAVGISMLFSGTVFLIMR